ncbi:MAG: zinc ribbon domain-containing protein [Lachnospiraceae bacterium]|nr:zinc ribbon domain-containing protein [Lachnospiraceae bacterium]
MICIHCGEQIDDNVSFCVKCGKRIPRCPGCGMVIADPTLRFCTNCGKPIPADVLALVPKVASVEEIPDETPLQEPPVNADSSQEEQKKKLLIIGIALAVVLLALAAALLLPKLKGGRDGKKPAQETVTKVTEQEETITQTTTEIEITTEETTTTETTTEETTTAETTTEETTTVPETTTEETTTQPETTTQETTTQVTSAKISMDHIADVSCSSYLIEANLGFYHEAKNIIDGSLDHAWVENGAGQGEGEWVRLEFDDVYTVSGFKIYAGYQKSDKTYYNNSRPARLRVSFSDGSSVDVTLEDYFGEQDVKFGFEVETSSITFKILSVYPGEKYEDTCISEISLY